MDSSAAESGNNEEEEAANCCCSCCRTCTLLFPMLLVAAFLSGLSLGAPGPTLLAIEHATRSREDQAVLLFAGRAVGAFCGALLGRFLADFVSPRTLIGCGLVVSAVGNSLVPACEHIWSVMPAFAVQGFGVYLCLSAVWAAAGHLRLSGGGGGGGGGQHRCCYLARRALLACLAAGMLAAPLVAAPFAQPGAGGLVPGNATVLDDHKSIHLMGVRVRRAISNSTDASNKSSVTMATKTSGSNYSLEHRNTSLHNLSTTGAAATTTAPSSLSTQLPRPPVVLSKKPVLTDGMHLDQSSSVADGSRHGRVLKLHKEQQRLGNIHSQRHATSKSSSTSSNSALNVKSSQTTIKLNNASTFENQSKLAINYTLLDNANKHNLSTTTISSLTATSIRKPLPTVAMATTTTLKPTTTIIDDNENEDFIMSTKTTSGATTTKTTVAPTRATNHLLKSRNFTINSTAATEKASVAKQPKLLVVLSSLFNNWRHLAPLYGVYASLAAASLAGAILAGLCALACWRRPYGAPPEAYHHYDHHYYSYSPVTNEPMDDDVDDLFISAVSAEQAALRLGLFIAAFCLHSLEVTLGCYLFSYSVRYLHLTVLSGLTLVCLLYAGLLAARLAALAAGVCLRWSRSYRFQLAAGSLLLCCGVACLWPWGSRWLCLSALLSGAGLALLLPALEDACDVWLLSSPALSVNNNNSNDNNNADMLESQSESTHDETVTAEESPNPNEETPDHNNNADEKILDESSLLLSPEQIREQQQRYEARRCASSFLACGQLTGEMLVPAFTAYLHRVTSSPLVLVHVSILLASASLLAVCATCYVGWSLSGAEIPDQQPDGYSSLAQDDADEADDAEARVQTVESSNGATVNQND